MQLVPLHHGGISREDFIAGVAKDILAKIPVPFDMPVIRKMVGVPTPCQVVLLQELDRFNKLQVGAVHVECS
jgi:dynein heavy chain